MPVAQAIRKTGKKIPPRQPVSRQSPSMNSLPRADTNSSAEGWLCWFSSRGRIWSSPPKGTRGSQCMQTPSNRPVITGHQHHCSSSCRCASQCRHLWKMSPNPQPIAPASSAATRVSKLSPMLAGQTYGKSLRDPPLASLMPWKAAKPLMPPRIPGTQRRRTSCLRSPTTMPPKRGAPKNPRLPATEADCRS